MYAERGNQGQSARLGLLFPGSQLTAVYGGPELLSQSPAPSRHLPKWGTANMAALSLTHQCCRKLHCHRKTKGKEK